MKTETLTPFLLESSWQAVLKEELTKPYLLELASFLEEEYTRSPGGVFPPKDLIFNSFIQTPLNKVRVVIVGQDPYHGPNQAHGLSFSVPVGTRVPPSLQNIFKEIGSDLNLKDFKHGCLLSWAQQGVLLLNSTLTVRQSEPLSHHGKGWEKFTDAILSLLGKREEPLVFVLWGKSAQDKCRFFQGGSSGAKHLILTAPHPSPFSAHSGFFGCRHFSKINAFLESKGEKPIDWALL